MKRTICPILPPWDVCAVYIQPPLQKAQSRYSGQALFCKILHEERTAVSTVPRFHATTPDFLTLLNENELSISSRNHRLFFNTNGVQMNATDVNSVCILFITSTETESAQLSRTTVYMRDHNVEILQTVSMPGDDRCYFIIELYLLRVRSYKTR